MAEERKILLGRQLKITLLATLILFLLSASASHLFSIGETTKHDLPIFWGIRFDVWFLTVSALLIVPILSILKQQKLNLATTCFSWLLAFISAGMSVMEGGLYSIAVMGFPIIAIFSALYLRPAAFISICVFLSVMVIAMGINHYVGGFQGVSIPLSARILDSLILVLASAYVAWLFGTDIRRSVSNLKQEHQRLIESRKIIQHLADTDSLTGLANRASAHTRYVEMRRSLDFESEEIGLYFIDLDNFKAINDLFDHHTGDELLITIGARLENLDSAEGIACRMGGDEFVLLVKAPKPFDHDVLAKEIVEKLSKPHAILGANISITVSVGIAIITNRGMSFDEARKRADIAMYKAKQLGKNGFHHYSLSLHRDHMEGLKILTDLKGALNKDFFDLHFQPKVSLGTGRVVGTEALLRWSRNNPSQLTPDEFMPVIESTELIHDVGAWVLKQACLACKEWHRHGHLITVAVNVSALQLLRNSFYDVVVDALKSSELSAKFLEIEITEHFLIQENDEIRALLNKLKSLGLSLAIDDFGTGYSNMGYLTRLAVDTLKLDRQFISQIENSPDSLAIVTAIIEMAGVLGMKVVAEGVERESECEVLQDLGCDIGQGFLWSKALPNKTLLEYLKPGDGDINLAGA